MTFEHGIHMFWQDDDDVVLDESEFVTIESGDMKDTPDDSKATNTEQAPLWWADECELEDDDNLETFAAELLTISVATVPKQYAESEDKDVGHGQAMTYKNTPIDSSNSQENPDLEIENREDEMYVSEDEFTVLQVCNDMEAIEEKCGTDPTSGLCYMVIDSCNDSSGTALTCDDKNDGYWWYLVDTGSMTHVEISETDMEDVVPSQQGDWLRVDDPFWIRKK